MSSDKISEVAEILYAIAHSGITDTIDFIDKTCKEIFEKHKGFDKETRNKIGFEFIAIFLHITSRMSIGILGEDKGWDLIKKRQQIFADHMMHSIDNNLNNERKELELSLKLILKERHLEYAKYKAFPKTDESLKDTLFFEFGKHICEATGCPMDIRLVIAACSGAFAFTKGVKWNKILREVV